MRHNEPNSINKVYYYNNIEQAFQKQYLTDALGFFASSVADCDLLDVLRFTLCGVCDAPGKAEL